MKEKEQKRSTTEDFISKEVQKVIATDTAKEIPDPTKFAEQRELTEKHVKHSKDWEWPDMVTALEAKLLELKPQPNAASSHANDAKGGSCRQAQNNHEYPGNTKTAPKCWKLQSRMHKRRKKNRTTRRKQQKSWRSRGTKNGCTTSTTTSP